MDNRNNNYNEKINNSVEINSILMDVFGESDLEYQVLGNIKLLRNIVIKILKYNVILKIYGDKNRWKREIFALSLFEREEYTPRLYDFGTKKDIGWAVIPYVDGTLVKDQFTRSKRKEKKETLFKMGLFLRNIHDNYIYKDKNIYVTYTPFKVIDSKKFIYNNFKKNEKRISEAEFMDKIFYDTFEKIEENYFKVVNSDISQITYCHNDYGIRNLIENKKNYILIDFENGYFSERELDIANVLLDYYDNEEFKDCFLSGYEKDRTLLNLEKINFYMLLKCIDICSWSKEKDFNYFSQAREVLEELICR